MPESSPNLTCEHCRSESFVIRKKGDFFPAYPIQQTAISLKHRESIQNKKITRFRSFSINSTVLLPTSGLKPALQVGV